jgi:hypothetical protein
LEFTNDAVAAFVGPFTSRVVTLVDNDVDTAVNAPLTLVANA